MFASLLALALVSSAGIQLDLDSNGGAIVRVIDGANGVVSVFVDGVANAPAMLGESHIAGQDLIFVPRYPFQTGQKYRIEFKGGTRVSKTVEIPPKAIATDSRIDHIYPTTATLPANQLKFYIQFSAPMSRGEAYRHIHLVDASSREVEHAFLELGEELWDSDQRRFTLLFDPGRIKRDLVPNLDDGAPLKPGGHYLIRVDKDWRDANNAPLRMGIEKEFYVVTADRESPDPKTWRIASPKAGSREPLTVDFPESMDYGLLLRTLSVFNGGGTPVVGHVAIERNETRWNFSPTESWRAGDFHLIVDGALEDLAGNRIGRPFEVDTRKSLAAANQTAAKSVSLSFTVK